MCSLELGASEAQLCLSAVWCWGPQLPSLNPQELPYTQDGAFAGLLHLEGRGTHLLIDPEQSCSKV